MCTIIFFYSLLKNLNLSLKFRLMILTKNLGIVFIIYSDRVPICDYRYANESIWYEVFIEI